MTRTRYTLLTLTLAFSIGTPADASVQVADVFGPEMILQRDAPVPVWGTVEPGEAINNYRQSR